MSSVRDTVISTREFLELTLAHLPMRDLLVVAPLPPTQTMVLKEVRYGQLGGVEPRSVLHLPPLRMKSLYDLTVLFVDFTGGFFRIRWRNDDLELEVDLAVTLAFGTEPRSGGFQTKGAVRM
ncbi:hypothetical protein DFH08DRAFT_821012 [Mycena albidolilacea]|uniref:Uncharacterized protein n=1 Tax=Mycena albidolilacea TaxID=1033008 RepID=A0AAD7EEY8_9AGAR|nr:hypothetical protein DFH08DRAFT_821012 [Mycena albidolilacea]